MRINYLIAAVLVVLIFWTSPANAEVTMVAKNPNGDEMRLAAKPCGNQKVLQHVPAQYVADMQAGTTTIAGKQHAMCWLLRADGVVVAVYEDGEGGLVPLQFFAPEEGV